MGEQQKFEVEKRNPKPDIPIIGSVTNLLSQNENKSDTSLEKGQLDNNEQEQLKISPSTSSATVSHKSSPIKNASPQTTKLVLLVTKLKKNLHYQMNIQLQKL